MLQYTRTMKNIKFHCNECKVKALERVKNLKAIPSYSQLDNMELARKLGTTLESVKETKKLL